MESSRSMSPLRQGRATLEMAVCALLAVLLITQDPRGVAPYALLGLAIMIGVRAYWRAHRDR